MVDLTGKRALVCGSTQGMGYATAMAMARLGASVTLAARNPESLTRALAELDGGDGQRHGSVCHDFDDPVGLQAKVLAIIEAEGAFQILVNNTGGPPGGAILDADPGAFEIALRRHLIGNQLLTQAVVPGMKAHGFGRIINIISTSVKTPIPGLGVSNTTRGAVASWAKTMAGELAADGITVNNILPGFIDTARIYDVINARAAATGRPVEEMHQAFLNQVPAGRFGTPDEVAAAICFLASDAAAYVTGINLPVDGGRTPTL